jgi:hypothetical protein
LIKGFLIVAGMLVFVSFPLNVYAFAITVPNGSFESPNVADGSAVVQTTSGIYFDWQFGQFGQFGVIDSNDSFFPDTTGDGLLPDPAEGQQFAILEGGEITSVSPVATIQNNLIYTLSVAVSKPSLLNLGLVRIQLMADRIELTANSTVPAGGFFELLSTSFSTASDGGLYVGFPLNIRISQIPGLGAKFSGPTFVDNVTVQANAVSSVPDLGNTAALLAFGLMGLGYLHWKASPPNCRLTSQPSFDHSLLGSPSSKLSSQ